MKLKDKLNGIRTDLLMIEQAIHEVKSGVTGDAEMPIPAFVLQPVSNKGEILANLTLAFRHIEDARMRLGKSIQAYDGGVSVYGAGRDGACPKCGTAMTQLNREIKAHTESGVAFVVNTILLNCDKCGFRSTSTKTNIPELR